MSQSKKVSTGGGGPLKVVCPCGFSKQIPSSFDGKKVVCPKCRKVLSVTRVKRAILLTQCPYCKKAQHFDRASDTCRSCKKSFKPPKFIEALDEKRVSESSSDSLLEERVSNSEPLLDVGAQPQVSVAAVPGKPRKRSGVWNLLMVLFYIGGSVVVAWVVVGDKLGLPTFGDVTGLGEKVLVPAASIGDQENPANEQENPAADQENPAADQVQESVESPKLLSPSVAIVGGQFVVDQVLDQQTSKVIGSKTMVDLQVENLTDLEITNIALKLDCTKEDEETVTFDVDQVRFSRGFMPKASGVLSFVCEPGNWESIAVSIVSVESGDESDVTVIGPHIIKKSHSLTKN